VGHNDSLFLESDAKTCYLATKEATGSTETPAGDTQFFAGDYGDISFGGDGDDVTAQQVMMFFFGANRQRHNRSEGRDVRHRCIASKRGSSNGTNPTFVTG